MVCEKPCYLLSHPLHTHTCTEELSQITSSLPPNRLLSLFIERHKQI